MAILFVAWTAVVDVDVETVTAYDPAAGLVATGIVTMNAVPATVAIVAVVMVKMLVEEFQASV
jgi:hypothetical protein